jgi:hypothetical protein
MYRKGKLHVGVTAEFTESPWNTISLQDMKMNGWGGGGKYLVFLTQ